MTRPPCGPISPPRRPAWPSTYPEPSPTFVSPVEELTPSDSGTCGPAVTDGVPWRELHHPEQPTGADVGLPADVERDLARILARALVQQFRADMASQLSSVTAADADPCKSTPCTIEGPIGRDERRCRGTTSLQEPLSRWWVPPRELTIGAVSD